MKTKQHQKTTGMKLAVLAFALFMMLTGSISAQHHGPPPPPRFDSTFLSHLHQWDSILHNYHDSIIVFNHHDTVPPIVPCHGDSGHLVIHHDTIPGPPPNWGDSTNAGGHHDTIPLPPNWGDSTNAGGHRDTVPPPPNWGDSTNAGGHHDTIPLPPPPPNWGDSTGGGTDTGGPPHRDLLASANNSSSATLLVFPNPVFETATIRIQNTSSTVTFRMYESTGRLVSVISNLSNGDFQLNKGNLTAGIYFYEMLDGNTIASKGSVVIR